MADSIGQLTFDIGVEERTITDLLGQLEKVRKTAQSALDARSALGLEDALAGTTRAAKGVTTELTASQKAIKTYASNVREAVALEKSGLATREATVRTIRTLTGEIKGQLGTLDKLGKEHGELARAMTSAGTAADKLEVAQKRANSALDLEKVRQYRDAVSSLRTEFERTGARDDFIRDTEKLQAEMLELRNDLPKTGKAFGQLDRVIGTSARGIQTAQGNISQLGMSQQIAIGTTRRLGEGFGNLGMAITPLLGGLGLAGLTRVASDWVGEAQRAESASVLFDKAIERFGLNASEANGLVERLADQFGVLPSVVQEAAIPMLRVGLSLETVEGALVAAGASAAAAGGDIAGAMGNIGQAVATGRSELTESANIMTNASAAWEAYADQLGVSVDALTDQQKAQAFANAIMDETRYEVEDLSSVLTEQVRAQQDFRTAMAEARQELGSQFAPVLTKGAEAATLLLRGFEGIPEGMQASVLGIGGVTGVTTVLAGALGGLRLALLPLFAPPAGLIIAGATAVAALGVTLAKLIGNAEGTGNALDVFTTRWGEGLAALGDLAGKAFTAIKTAFGNIRTEIGTSNTITATLLGGLGELFGNTVEGIGTVLTKIPTFFIGVNNASQELGNALGRIFGPGGIGLVLEGFGEIVYGYVVEPFQRLAEPIADAAARVSLVISRWASSVGKFFEPFTDFLRSLGRNVSDAFGDVATATIGGITAELTEGIDGSSAAFASFTAESETLQSGLNKVAGGMAGVVNAVSDGSGAINREIENITTNSGEAAAAGEVLTESNESIASSSSEAAGALGEVPPATEGAADGIAKVGGAARDIIPDITTAVGVLQGLVIPDVSAAVDTFQPYRLLIQQLVADLKAQGEQLRVTGTEITDNAKAAEQAAEDNDIWSRSVQGVTVNLLDSSDVIATVGEEVGILGEEFENLADVTDEVALPMPEVTAEFTDYVEAFQKDLPRALKESAEVAELFGENFNPIEAQAEAIRAEIESLIERGLEPNHEAVQDLSERYLELTAEMKDNATEAEKNEKAQDRLTKIMEEMEAGTELTASQFRYLTIMLESLAEGETTAAEEARQLLKDLEALQVAKVVGALFLELGELAGAALEAFPGMAREGVIGLGALEGAAETTFEALQDGSVNAVDALGILSGALDGIERALGEELPEEARIGFDAVQGALGGAAAGAVFGPWGAIVGGVLGGITGLFNGIAEEQERVRELQEQITEEVERSAQAADDFREASEARATGTGSDLLQKRLDAETPDTFKDNKKGERQQAKIDLAQARIDLIELNEAYSGLMSDARTRLDDINDEISSLNALLRNPNASAAAKAEARESLADLETARINTEQELDNLAGMYAYDVQEVLREAEGAAEKLGLSSKELYEAILTGNDEILGALNPAQREAIFDSLSAYYAEFGILPEGAAQAAAALGLSVTEITEALDTGDAQLSTGMGLSTQSRRQSIATYNQQLVDMLGPEAAEPIRRAILAAYNKQAGAFGEGSTTLTTEMGSTAQTLSVQGAAAIRAPGDAAEVAGGPTAQKIRDAFAAINLAQDDDGGVLLGRLESQAIALSQAQHEVFNAQKEQILAQTEVLRNVTRQSYQLLVQEHAHGVHGKPGGLVAVLGRGQNAVNLAINSFYDSQRRNVGGQTTLTVSAIDNAAGSVRQAMNRLIAASTAGRNASFRASGGGGGGGGGLRSTALGLFAPLSSVVDERALGGLGDEFGSFQTRANSIINDIEGNTFGYGTSYNAVKPVGDSYRGGRRAGPLGGLLASVREGVEVYKEGFVSAVNSASETTRKGFDALGYNFRQGIIKESKRNRALIKGQKKTTKELRDEFLSSFTLIGGKSLLKQIGGPRSGLYDFALQIGKSIEEGFKTGVENGAQAFLEGTGSMLETLQRDAFDQLAFGTIQKLLNSGLVEKLLGGVYTDFAAALAGGDTNNAIAKFQKVIEKLPSVAGQLEAILAPIRGIGNSLGYGAQAPEVENIAQGIRLEARSLGSATPDWAIKLGQAAELQSRAADIQYKAAQKMEAAVSRIGNGKLEVRKPSKLRKF